MVMQKRQLIERRMNVLWGNININYKSKRHFLGQEDYKLNIRNTSV